MHPVLTREIEFATWRRQFEPFSLKVDDQTALGSLSSFVSAEILRHALRDDRITYRSSSEKIGRAWEIQSKISVTIFLNWNCNFGRLVRTLMLAKKLWFGNSLVYFHHHLKWLPASLPRTSRPHSCIILSNIYPISQFRLCRHLHLWSWEQYLPLMINVGISVVVLPVTPAGSRSATTVVPQIISLKIAWLHVLLVPCVMANISPHFAPTQKNAYRSK